MQKHAISQIDDSEATRLVLSALAEPRYADTLTSIRGSQVTAQETVDHSMVETPEGPIHRVAIIAVNDGEVIEVEHFYRDPQDARLVFDNIVDSLRVQKEAAKARRDAKRAAAHA